MWHRVTYLYTSCIHIYNSAVYKSADVCHCIFMAGVAVNPAGQTDDGRS
jgi:hypothetical protein